MLGLLSSQLRAEVKSHLEQRPASTMVVSEIERVERGSEPVAEGENVAEDVADPRDVVVHPERS